VFLQHLAQPTDFRIFRIFSLTRSSPMVIDVLLPVMLCFKKGLLGIASSQAHIFLKVDMITTESLAF
jgi:hypothetical protein